MRAMPNPTHLLEQMAQVSDRRRFLVHRNRHPNAHIAGLDTPQISARRPFLFSLAYQLACCDHWTHGGRLGANIALQ